MDQEHQDGAERLSADELREEYELAKAEFDRRAAEDAAKGVVRKWDGTNGMTTADVLTLFRKLEEQAGGAR